MKVSLKKRYNSDSKKIPMVEEVVGEAVFPPQYGKPFLMSVVSLDSEELNIINTSSIKELSLGKKGENDFYTFRTKTGSVYTVEVLD